jgi:hypothetical protein
LKLASVAVQLVSVAVRIPAELPRARPVKNVSAEEITAAISGGPELPAFSRESFAGIYCFPSR